MGSLLWLNVVVWTQAVCCVLWSCCLWRLLVLMLLILSLVQMLKPESPSGYGVMSNSVPWLYLSPLTTQCTFPALGALSPAVCVPLRLWLLEVRPPPSDGSSVRTGCVHLRLGFPKVGLCSWFRMRNSFYIHLRMPDSLPRVSQGKGDNPEQPTRFKMLPVRLQERA